MSERVDSHGSHSPFSRCPGIFIFVYVYNRIHTHVHINLSKWDFGDIVVQLKLLLHSRSLLSLDALCGQPCDVKVSHAKQHFAD